MDYGRGVGRNAPCPCGSRKKYKRCHGRRPTPFEFLLAKRKAITEQRTKFNRVRVRLDDIGERSDSPEELITGVRHFDRETLFHTLSRIENVLTNKRFDLHEVQNYFSQRFVHQDIADKINAFAKKNGVAPLLVEPQTVLDLQKLFVRYGVDGGSKIESVDDRARFGRLLLSMNAYIDADSGSHSSEQDIQAIWVRSAFFTRHQKLEYLAPRYWDLYVTLPKKFRTRTAFDINAAYLKATGISIEEMLAVGFSFMKHWIDIDLTNAHERAIDINPPVYFKDTNIPKERVDRALDQLSADWASHAEAIKVEEGRSYAEYRFKGARDKPLMRLGRGSLVPFGVAFFQEKVTAHVYWTIVNHFTAEREFVRAFTACYGELFEEYVLRILRGVYGDQVVKARYGDNDAEKGDALLVEDDWLFVIECKTPRVRYETRVTGNLAEFENDLDRSLFHAAEQADGVIQLAQAGQLDDQIRTDHKKLKFFQPVFVLEDALPQDHLLWKFYVDRLDKRGLLKQVAVRRPLLLTCEELEMLEPILTGGLRLKEFVLRKEAVPAYADTCAHNTIIDAYLKSGASMNNRMVDKFHQLQDEIARMLFQK